MRESESPVALVTDGYVMMDHDRQMAINIQTGIQVGHVREEVSTEGNVRLGPRRLTGY